MKNIIRTLRYSFLAPMPESRKSDNKIKDFIRKYRFMFFGHIPWIGRRRAYGETHKAHARRLKENFFNRYCVGRGLDIGYGGDPVVPNAQGWDFEHGDAHHLNGLADESFDFVYSSHLLEHLPDCELALTNWWRVLKSNGYLILFVPHRDLYEKKKTLPSRFNDDHAHFFLPDTDEAPDTIGIVPMIKRVLPNSEIIYSKVCDEGFAAISETQPSVGEFSIEVVIRKR